VASVEDLDFGAFVAAAVRPRPQEPQQQQPVVATLGVPSQPAGTPIILSGKVLQAASLPVAVGAPPPVVSGVVVSPAAPIAAAAASQTIPRAPLDVFDSLGLSGTVHSAEDFSEFARPPPAPPSLHDGQRVNLDALFQF
jgi:hypothetical protein